MADEHTDFENLTEQLYEFRKQRGWLDLSPADLAKSIVLEAAELLEHYQWDNTDIKKYSNAAKKDKNKIASETADIFIYLLEFCRENDIDLLEATMQKIQYLSKKYPAEVMKNGGYEAYETAKKSHRKQK